MSNRAEAALWWLGLSGCVVGVEQHVTFDDPVDRVEIVLSTGDVSVDAAPGKATLDGTFVGPNDDADLVSLRDGVLRVAVDCSACAGTVELTVPAATELDIVTRAGSVEVDGMAADVSARVEVGSLSVVRQRAGLVDLWARAGDVELQRDAADDTRVEVRQGDAELRLPAGRWDLDLAVDGGDRSVDPAFVDDPSGPLLWGRVTAGSLSVDPL